MAALELFIQRSSDNVSIDTTQQQWRSHGGNVLSLCKMIQMEKRKKLEAVSHLLALLTKEEFYKNMLLQMCYITDVSCSQQNQASSKLCLV